MLYFNHECLLIFFSAHIQVVLKTLLKFRDIVERGVSCHEIVRFIPVPWQGDVKICRSVVILVNEYFIASIVYFFKVSDICA